jgi:hypothetical protein
MATTFTPSTTVNTQANLLASGSLAASGTTTADLDLTGKFGADVQVKDTGGGTVAATNGVQVDVFRLFGAGPTADTLAVLTFVIPTTTSTATYKSLHLETGKYRIKLTTLDASNAVTVEMTSTTNDSIVGV